MTITAPRRPVAVDIDMISMIKSLTAQCKQDFSRLTPHQHLLPSSSLPSDSKTNKLQIMPSNAVEDALSTSTICRRYLVLQHIFSSTLSTGSDRCSGVASFTAQSVQNNRRCDRCVRDERTAG